MMKMALNKLRDESGQALILVLILLLLAGLIIGGLLSFMSTGLKSGQVFENKMYQFYAADAGVEEALSYLPRFVTPSWGNKHDIGPYSYKPGPKERYYERKTTRDYELEINRKTVELVRVEREGPEESPYYKITSTAGADDSSTTITSYVEFVDFSCLWEDYLAISRYSEVLDRTNEHGDDIKGPYPTVSWPTADYLEGYYQGQVDTSDPFPYDHLNVGADNTTPEKGLYSDNVDGFLIEGESSSEDNKLTLYGTVYIEGDLLNLGFESGNFFTLDLNGQTIFVEGGIRTGNKQSFAVNGTGCIIALGEIEFRPGIEFNPDEFVFIMSVTDKVTIWPNPDFNGAIAGADTVELRSGDGDYFHDLPDGLDLNFPQDTDAPITILSWQTS